MKKIQHKQQGATLISWLIGISVGIFIISGALQVGPHYLEYHSIKSFMNDIAAEPGIEKKNKREILAHVDRYLNINSVGNLTRPIVQSQANKRGDNPFQVVKLKKGNKRELAVHYEVKKAWMGNLSFLMDYKYSVELGSKQK